uniref:Sulfate transport ATP-binding protein n=1 Tax=Anthoceros punctatus TaxID=3234 RepID=A0A6M8ASH2_ANTPU|nr:sulfate transport ATP-binding protein [Anthoceros punctatus]QKD76414.1 sulfate transport ATP-binding protein [Anthoceros punctatus]
MSIPVYEVSKSLGNFKVPDRVSLYVRKVSLVAFSGPSGSGKSSLLRIIAGLDSPDYGSVWLHGIDMTNTSTQYRHMAFVSQHYALSKNMTVYENTSFGLRLRGFSYQKIRNKVNDLLDCLRIPDIVSEYPGKLSGGQKQRVALARSLAIKSDFPSPDEPFGASDGELRRHLSKWLKRYLKDNGITTIMVTHDQKEVISMADEIVVLKQGRFLQQGRSKNLYDEPIDYFVGIFPGSFIEFPQLEESLDAPLNSSTTKSMEKDFTPFIPDLIWSQIFTNQSIHHYHFFLRLHELYLESQIDLKAIPVQIKKIIYKRTFVQLDLSITLSSWNITIPIGYQAFRKLNIQSFVQKLYIKPRNQVYLRAYPKKKNIISKQIQFFIINI